MRHEDAVLRLQQGEKNALDELYQAFAEQALRTAYLITGSQTSAEDAVHDAFVEVLRHIRSLREPAYFKTWFYRIVVNKAKRAMRKGVLKFLPFDLSRYDYVDSTSVPPDEAVIQAAERAELLAAIERLPESHRVPLVLRYYTQLTDGEIAAALDLAVGTVKSRLFNARRALHVELVRERGQAEGAGGR